MPAPVHPSVAALAQELARLPGAVAVALVGSRAAGTHRADSDWDLALYRRESEGRFDPAAVRALGHPGHVSALGEWGPIVDGGGWLTVGGQPVDVLFRDLDRVEHWAREAARGRFEVLLQNGSVVGAPTYVPVGELALCRPLAGDLARPGFPEALAAAAPARWSGRAGVALMFAGTHARLGDAVPCAGMLATAVLCAAHARLAARREWALTEKGLVDRAGLGATRALLAAPGTTREALLATVEALGAELGIEALSPR